MRQRVFFSIVLVLTFYAGYGQIVSDFTAVNSTDGWTNSIDLIGTNPVTPVYNGSGGNPGGYISVTYATGGFTNYWLAPAKFLGNRCVSSYNQHLKFDLQESPSSTDNTNADVILWDPANERVYFFLTPLPGTTWTSYSLLLNETAGWHYNSPAGPAPTKDQMKTILENLSAIQIRSKHSFPIGTLSGIDNVVLEIAPAGPPAPLISSISPVSANPGTTVSINGSNFDSAPLNNLVFFGTVSATVQNATPTQLTVTVPQGAVFGRITITNASTGLEAQSLQNFNPTFDNNQDFGGTIIAASMELKFDINMDASAVQSHANAADLDGDGLTDLVVVENNFKKVSVLRNTSIKGVINASSFAPKVSFDIGYTSKGANVIADLDNDGKPDIAVGTANASYALIAIFHNISTSGNIAFDPVQYITASSYSDGSLHAADIDGDGKIELLSAFNNSCGGAGAYFTIFQNLSQPGDVEFCAFLDFDFGILCQSDDITTGDLDGDGKLDIAVTSSFDNVFYVFQNTSTPGTLSLATPFLMDSPGSTYNVIMADLDADGKLDLTWKADSPNEIYIRKNIYTGGALSASSFSADIAFQTPISSGGTIRVTDINGDGRPDIVAADNQNLVILQNNSIPGTLNTSSFSSGTIFQGENGVSNPTTIVVADFDADTKPDIAFGTTASNPALISIYRNECYPAPTITSLSPLTGSAGSPLTLTGNLMFTANQTPTLQFGAAFGSVGTASNTSVTTSIPLGASYSRVGVTLHGLTDFNDLPISTTFPTVGSIDATTFTSPVEYAMTNNTGAMAVADFDKDGKIDIVAEDATTLKIFRNTLSSAGANIDNASFTVLSTTYPNSARVTSGDFDGDGWVDVITNGFINRNNSGTQTDPISFEASINTVAGSANRFVTNHDFNHDGKMDVAYTDNGNLVRVTGNTSRKGPFSSILPFATFQPVISLTPGGQVLGIDGGDFDGDGFDDLAYAVSSGTTINVHLNTMQKGPITATQFAAGFPVTVGSHPFEVVAVDLDQDGKLDLAVCNNNSAFLTVLKNTSSPGSLSFVRQDITALNLGSSIRAADLNGDGKPELVTIHQLTATTGSFTIFPNTSSSGTISFGARVDYALLNKPEGLALADLNLDQKTDIIIPRNGDFLSVFQNNLALANIIAITTQPADISVCNGATATFTTASTGTTNIIYQWQFAAISAGPFADIADGAAYSGASTNTLSVNTTGNFGAGRYRCKIQGDNAAAVLTNDEGLFINTPPAAPAVVGTSNCGPGSLSLAASGGSNGDYRWYTVATGGTSITGEVNSIYVTPVITASTTYYVSIVSGSCEGSRTAVVADIKNIPAAPSATGASACAPASVTLDATGGSNGQYRWYTLASAGTAIAGEINSTYLTPLLSSTTTYYVAINDGFCESARTPVIVDVQNCPNNQPPVISPGPESTGIGGQVTIDIGPITSDPDNNLDLSTLIIIQQPSSGAVASIDVNHVLTINYQGIAFSGTDTMIIQVCDLAGACVQKEIEIQVSGVVIVYNALSINGDGKNEGFILEFIDVIPSAQSNRVTIYNRWGDEVFDINDYNNTSRLFIGVSSDGKLLPSGTYFYRVVFGSGAKTLNGYLELKR